VSYSYSNRRRVGLSLSQRNADPWNQSYAYDEFARLTNVTSQAGSFGYAYEAPPDLPDMVATLTLPDNGGTFYIENQHDGLARLTSTTLHTSYDWTANTHSYDYDNANQRVRQDFQIRKLHQLRLRSDWPIKNRVGHRIRWCYGGAAKVF
jgi:YD repeat-containing protein